MLKEDILQIAIKSFPSTQPDLIEISSALLTPTIAILGIYIAYQQYKTNNQRLRYETYERRLHIYRTIQSFLSEVLREGTTNYNNALKFLSDTSEAYFLFDNSVQEKIDFIYKNSIEMASLNNQLYSQDGSRGLPSGKERYSIVNKHSKLLKWHSE